MHSSIRFDAQSTPVLACTASHPSQRIHPRPVSLHVVDDLPGKGTCHRQRTEIDRHIDVLHAQHVVAVIKQRAQAGIVKTKTFGRRAGRRAARVVQAQRQVDDPRA